MSRGKRLYEEDLLKMDGQKVLVWDEVYDNKGDVIHTVNLNYGERNRKVFIDEEEMFYTLAHLNEEENLEVYELIKDTEIPINKLYMAKTKPNAILPTKRAEDAGRDIYTCETETIVIEPCSTRLVDTGIAIACNKAWFPKFFDKGGMGSKGIVVGAGVGDSGYRDGYFIPLINTNKDKTVVITAQSDDEIDECNYFNLDKKVFEFIDKAEFSKTVHLKESVLEMFKRLNLTPFNIIRTRGGSKVVKKENCIVKPLSKAITQFVMLPVPELEDEEISWEELQLISSERGLGKTGSSGK